jgi:hypothetical protein
LTLLQNNQDFVAKCYFFIGLEANQSEYGPYLLHIRIFRYIHIHNLFASFTYTLQNIAQIHLQIFDLMQNKYMLKHIFTSELIPALTFSHTGKYVLQTIRFEANIRKNSSEFHIQAFIC